MEADRDDGAGLDRAFFEGRFLLEIEAWEANLHVGLSPPATPVEYRFQGGLSYVRGFEIRGRVVAPKEHQAKLVRVWLSLVGPDVQFGSGPEDLDEVGQLHSYSPSRPGRDFGATLFLPESALPMTATCLGSGWKYLHIWTFDGDEERASVSAFSFSSTVHKNLDAWIAGT